MADIRAKSLSEYFSRVREIRRSWDVSGTNELWFRAEDEIHEATRLQPGLYRPRVAETRRSVEELLELENDLYEEFGRCAGQLSDVQLGSSDWEWDSYFLMQHHGVPTRILDWSDGALIAFHFAVRDKPTRPKSGSIVFILDPEWLDVVLEMHPDRLDAISRWKRFVKKHPGEEDEDEWDRLYLPSDEDDAKERLLDTPKIPLLVDSPHLTRRFAAQRSRLMLFGSDPTWVADIVNKRDSRIVSIDIPADTIDTVKAELREAGVTESVVFPDLDGLGRELKQVWEARR